MKTAEELKAELEQLRSQPDSQKKLIRVLNNIIKHEYRSDPSAAMAYAEEALALAKALDDREGIAASYNNIGISFWATGEYSKALDNYGKAMEVWQEQNNKLGISKIYNNIGNIYREQGNLRGAFDNYVKSLNLKEEIDDKKGMFNSFLNIGNILKQQGNYPRAKERYLQALDLCRTVGDKRDIAICYNNIGMILTKQGELIPAREQHENALKLREEIGDKGGIANSCGNIGLILETQERYEEALEYFVKTLSLKEELSDRRGISTTCCNIGSIYMKMKQQDEAEKYGLRGLGIAREIGARDSEITALDLLWQVYEAAGNHQKALEFLKQYNEVSESVEHEKAGKELARLQIQFETERKERESEIYRQKNLELQKEISIRMQVEDELRKHRGHLEELVQERTAELTELNKGLEREIRERKKAQEGRTKAEADLQSFLNHVDDIVYFRSKDGQITDLNDAYSNLTGYSRDDFRKDPNLWGKITHPDDWKVSSEFFRKNPDGVTSFEYEYRLRAKTGEWTWLHSLMVGVWDDNKVFQGYNCIDRDITERKEAEQRLRQSYEKLETSFQGTVFTISKIIETRDPYTSGHQLRTAELARLMAIEMKMTEEQVQAIYLAAVVHDIGKMNVPQEYLSKPGKLSDLERDVIRTHPRVGYEILSTIEFPWPIADIVLNHHELLDGSGYPSGLKGEEIPIEARVLCVADAVEAMGSHRPYRPTLGIERALEELSRNKGVLYDPQAVEACIKVIAQGKFEFLHPDQTLFGMSN